MKKLFLVTFVLLSTVLASATEVSPRNNWLLDQGQLKYMDHIGAGALGMYIDVAEPVNCRDAEIQQSLSRISKVDRTEYQRDLRWLDTLAQNGDSENQKQYYTNVLHCEARRIGLF